jgi:DNA-binding response OmpR family regulator
MKNILLIDDDEIIQLVLTKVLREEGFRVELAQNGQEGIVKMNLIPYDLVITDIMMPYVNGFEIMNRLKQHPNTANASVIVISSITHEATIMDSFKLGIDEYVRKPIMVADFVSKVKNILSRSRDEN